MSVMLLNQTNLGPNAFKKLKKEVKGILKVKKFGLDAYMKSSCKKDDNLKRFIHVADSEIKQLLENMHNPQKGSSSNTLGILLVKE